MRSILFEISNSINNETADLKCILQFANMRGREESSDHEGIFKTRIFLKDYFWSEKSFNTEAKRCFATNDEDIDSIECVYIQQFNTYAVQSGGCRFESIWGFGFFLKGAHYEVDYSGKKLT